MKAIQEFISLLKKFGITSADDLKVPFKNQSQTRQFFHFLQNPTCLEQGNTEVSFFKSTPTESVSHYTRRSLEDHLVQAIFWIDIKKMGNTAHQRAYYYCWKNLCAAKILLGQSAHYAAIRLIKKILHRANKYDLSDLSLESYRILRWYYGCIDPNMSKYQNYGHLLDKQRRVCEAEQLAEGYYTFLSNTYISDKGQRSFLAQKACLFWEEISALMSEYTSSRLHFLGHLIHVFHYSCAGDYQGAQAANGRAITFFEQKKGSNSAYLVPFLNHQLACCIKLKKLKEGCKLVEKIEKYIGKGSFDWFVHRQQFFLLAMHSRNYEQAHIVLHQTISNHRYKFLGEPQKEKWAINQSYLYYLETIGHLPENTNKRTAFLPKEFLNTVPLYAKDKRGMNVPILIISILILLAEGRYNEVIGRIEALDKYRRRYLKMEDEYRSNCFIQMLSTLPQAGFHPKAVVRKAEVYRNNLDRVPLPLSTQAFELEIIPYEELWAMVLKSL